MWGTFLSTTLDEQKGGTGAWPVVYGGPLSRMEQSPGARGAGARVTQHRQIHPFTLGQKTRAQPPGAGPVEPTA